MKKLMSVIVAAMFAVSTAFVATPVGAQATDKPKAEKKKGEGKKKAEGQKSAPKGEAKKTQKKGEGKKKDEPKAK